MKLILRWNNPNIGVTEVMVYRDTSPMNPASLPTPLITLAANALEYEDTTVVDSIQYYYRVSMLVDGNEKVSAEHPIYTNPDIPIETGMWLCGAAVYNEGRRNYNYTDTNFKSYDDFFELTTSFGVFAYNFTTSSTADTGVFSGTINKFNSAYEFLIHADGSESVSNRADFDIEFQDVSGNPKAAIRCVRDQADGGVSVFYGPSLSVLIQAPTIVSSGGKHAILIGNLKCDSIGFTFTTLNEVIVGDEYDYIGDFDFLADMTSVTKIVFSNCRSTQTITTVDTVVYWKMLPIQIFIDLETALNTPLSKVTLTWDEIYHDIDSVLIYRDTSPISASSLPTVLDTINGGIEIYEDIVPDNTANYFYMIDVQALGETHYSRSIRAFFSPFEYGLVCQYEMETITSAILVDETGDHDGTLVGNYSLGTGIDGNCIYYGDTSYAITDIDAEMDNLEMIEGNEFSICGWFKRTGSKLGSDAIIVGRGGGTGTLSTFAVFIADSSGASGQTVDEFHLVSRGGYTNTGVDITDGNWHFFLVDWNGYRGIFRLDGTEHDVTVGTASLTTATLGIGNRNGTPNPSTAFSPECDIDKIRGFSRTLNQTERDALANEY